MSSSYRLDQHSIVKIEERGEFIVYIFEGFGLFEIHKSKLEGIDFRKLKDVIEQKLLTGEGFLEK